MIVVEYRLPIPVSLEEYNRALRYVVARVAESTTGVTPGEGVEILVNEPFGPENDHGMPEGGVYTEKVLRFRSRLPPLLRRVMPMSVTEIHESSWFSNSKGSRCKTIYRNPFLGNRFYLSIESNHIAGIDTNDNAVNLSREDLDRRQTIHLDIAGDVPRKLPTEDPSSFVSQKTGRGKLLPNWWKTLEGAASSASDAAMGSPEELNTSSTMVDRDDPAWATCAPPDTSSSVASPRAASPDASTLGISTLKQEESGTGKDKMDDRLDAGARDEVHSVTQDASTTPPTPNDPGREIAPCIESAAVESKSFPESDAVTSSDQTSEGPFLLQPMLSSDDESPDDEREPSVAASEPEAAPLDEKHTMTCYKVVKMEFTGFGMRRFVQRWVTRAVIPNGFIDIHRKLFCWMDDWTDLTLKEIEAIENETAENVRAVFLEHESGDFTPSDSSKAPAQDHEYEYL